MPADNLVAVDHVRRRYVGESYYMPFSPEYRWYHLSRHGRNEALLIKNYDSKDVPARCENYNDHEMSEQALTFHRLRTRILQAQERGPWGSAQKQY